jgi:hypothetical protein
MKTTDRRLATAGLAAVALIPAATRAQAPTAIAGRRIVYSVAGYQIRMEFLSEIELRWTYLAAPSPGEVGKSEMERCDRVDLRPDLVLLAWTERSGANVVDVFDFERRRVHANFVMPDGKRYKSEAVFEREA